jgi:phytoene dehydrogenase-like protein
MPGIVIIGAGFGGIEMGIALKKAGFGDFVILEKSDELGGTWYDNQYPGCACDVPSPLYSYSFELNPSWSRLFAPRREIWEYLRWSAGGCRSWYLDPDGVNRALWPGFSFEYWARTRRARRSAYTTAPAVRTLEAAR